MSFEIRLIGNKKKMDKLLRDLKEALEREKYKVEFDPREYRVTQSEIDIRRYGKIFEPEEITEETRDPVREKIKGEEPIEVHIGKEKKAGYAYLQYILGELNENQKRNLRISYHPFLGVEKSDKVVNEIEELFREIKPTIGYEFRRERVALESLKVKRNGVEHNKLFKVVTFEIKKL